MDGEQRQQAVDIEQNAAELLLRNPYCSNEETHSGCRLPNMMVQPKRVTGKQWSLWKTFLVCLLACLIATALVVLVLYFVHFGKPTNITTVIIHADRTSNHVTCIPGSTSSPTSSSLPGSQSTLPSTLVAHQSSSTMVPRSPMETTKTTTWGHKIITENKK
ncbi:dynactin-associated protein-like [Diceros bicornis minor]|uniref:dynactin-associated protein-like n=1 Tax=Diceros bicornis minor TaxID=77932 RepID=UPI0026EF19C4|nr:dynactin-associated protein-like [Diceros bicornis minor]